MSKIDIEQLLKEQGGLGRIQWFALAVIELQIVSASIMGYALPYLLLYPKLICEKQPGEFTECS